MEQSEGFKCITTQIKTLEQQLSLCDTTLKECEQYGIKAQKEIEEYFGKLMNELATRKAALLEEVTKKVASQSSSLLPLL